MVTYDIKLGRRWWFPLKLKNVKSHAFLPKVNAMNTPTTEPEGQMMIIFGNEERLFINVKDYKYVWFSDGWFKQEAARIREESQGKAIIDR